MRCGEKFTGTVMVPLEYPSVGWEPEMLSDICTRDKGHEGPHEGKVLMLDKPRAGGRETTP